MCWKQANWKNVQSVVLLFLRNWQRESYHATRKLLEALEIRWTTGNNVWENASLTIVHLNQSLAEHSSLIQLLYEVDRAACVNESTFSAFEELRNDLFRRRKLTVCDWSFKRCTSAIGFWSFLSSFQSYNQHNFTRNVHAILRYENPSNMYPSN